MKRLFWLVLVLLPALAVQAADGEAAVHGFPAQGWTLGILIIAAAVIAYAFLALFRLVRLLDRDLQITKQKLAGTWVEPVPEPKPQPVAELEAVQASDEPGNVAIFFGAPKVAIEDEDTIALDHNYDGIRELDNDLPPWWTALFYGSIVFGIFYMFHFHVLGTGSSPAEQYVVSMEKAEAAKAARLEGPGEVLNATTVTLLADAGSLAAGEAIYTQNCLTCHGVYGQGLAGAGPNFTDKYWIHGGAIGNLYTTIRYGVPAKGMIAWKDQLPPEKIQQVASYILSLQGTDPADALPPQGDLYEPEVEEAPAEEEGEPQTETPDDQQASGEQREITANR